MKALFPMTYWVSCVTMAIFGPYETLSVVHHRLMMLDGISLFWSLLPMSELDFSKMIEASIFWLIQGGLHLASHQHPSLSPGKVQC
jgi:hypothetical protein